MAAPAATATPPGVAISDRQVRLVSVTGPLGVDGIRVLHRHLADLVAAGESLLAVDLAGVTECDGRLFGVLSAVATALRPHGGMLRLVGLTDTVLAALSDAPLPDVLVVYQASDWGRRR